MRFKLNKGLDVPLAGAPLQSIESGSEVSAVALIGADYVGLEPRMAVAVGADVRLGDALFVDKRDPDVAYTAPGTGRVVAVHRGSRRVLKSVEIELDDNSDRVALDDIPTPTANRDAICRVLHRTGLWTAFRSRPFNRVPASTAEPRSIFVTAIDSRPLAAEPTLALRGTSTEFGTGLAILARLTEGSVYVCTPPGWQGPAIDGERVVHAEFEGPHPAGLPGTHIHHLDPVAADREVWHIGYQDVAAFGQLFANRLLSMTRTIALGGPAVRNPRHLQTRIGARVSDLVRGELNAAEDSLRIVSGSVLDGRRAEGSETFLGRYHCQVSALALPKESRTLAWLRRPSAFSFTSPLKRRSRHPAEALTAAQHGRSGALVPSDAFERLVPLDILPLPLLKALLVGDTEQAQALGCLELDAEDLALCSFVCPGKNDYGTVLRANLAQIFEEG